MVKKGQGQVGVGRKEQGEKNKQKEVGLKHICPPCSCPGFQQLLSLISISPLNAMGDLMECF